MTIENQLIPLSMPNVELGTNYLKFNSPPTDGDFSQVFKALNAMQQSSLWWIGDFLANVELKKGEAYARAYTLTDYSGSTLWGAKSVCKRIPVELRLNLSYSHHKEALGLTGDVALALEFLRQAEQEKLSVKQMRKQIVLSLGDPTKQEKTTLREVIDPETLQLQDAFYTIRRFLENTTSTSFSMRKAFVRAELETLAEWAQEICS